MTEGPSIFRPHGGYRGLRSFQAAQAVYDGTVVFCDRFVDKRSRTHDQMVQAARSGRQNIAEGSRASGTSARSEMKLVGVARASLDELLLDFEDFLRQHGLPLWAKEDPRALEVRAMGKDRTDRTDQTDRTDSFAPYRPLVAEGNAETAANTLICLIHQANYLLDRQLRSLERQFLREGGFTERLHAARVEARAGQNRTDRTDQSDRSDSPAPPCPRCGKPMVRRIARQGPRAGEWFWGCPGYPDCRGARPVESAQASRDPGSTRPSFVTR